MISCNSWWRVSSFLSTIFSEYQFCLGKKLELLSVAIPMRMSITAFSSILMHHNCRIWYQLYSTAMLKRLSLISQRKYFFCNLKVHHQKIVDCGIALLPEVFLGLLLKLPSYQKLILLPSPRNFYNLTAIKSSFLYI